jgi:hypothetical protein
VIHRSSVQPCVFTLEYRTTDKVQNTQQSCVAHLHHNPSEYMYMYNKFGNRFFFRPLSRKNRRRLCVALNCRLRAKKPDTNYLIYFVTPSMHSRSRKRSVSTRSADKRPMLTLCGVDTRCDGSDARRSDLFRVTERSREK